jgi:hypothetical protein
MGYLEETREWLASVATEGLGRLELLRNLDKSCAREWRWPLGGAANDAINLDERAKELVRTAERDGLSRYQRDVTYLAIAYRSEDQGGTKFAEHCFRVPGGSKLGQTALEEDQPATLAGLVAQTMKQNSELHRLLCTSHEGRTASIERQLAYVTEQLEQANRGRSELMALTEHAASLKMEREVQQRQMELEEKKQKYLGEKLDTFLPVALNRLMGGGPGSGKLPMADELIKQLFGKMSGERIEALLTGQPITLSPDEAMLVAEIYSTFGSKEKAREAMRGERPLNGTNGTNGAASAAHDAHDAHDNEEPAS